MLVCKMSWMSLFVALDVFQWFNVWVTRFPSGSTSLQIRDSNAKASHFINKLFFLAFGIKDKKLVTFRVKNEERMRQHLPFISHRDII